MGCRDYFFPFHSDYPNMDQHYWSKDTITEVPRLSKHSPERSLSLYLAAHLTLPSPNRVWRGDRPAYCPSCLCLLLHLSRGQSRISMLPLWMAFLECLLKANNWRSWPFLAVSFGFFRSFDWVRMVWEVFMSSLDRESECLLFHGKMREWTLVRSSDIMRLSLLTMVMINNIIVSNSSYICDICRYMCGGRTDLIFVRESSSALA